MRYPDGREVHLGDKVLLGDEEGEVVFSIDSDEYPDEFPKEQWAYLKQGVMFRMSRLGLIFQEDASTDLELVRRGGEHFRT